MSDTAHAETKPAEQETDKSYDTFTDDFFKEKPAAEAATPAAEAPKEPSAPAATPTPEAAAQAAAAKRLLKWKDEEGEHDFDIDEHYSDETKRGKLRELIEKGHAFERVIPRRQNEAVRAAFQEMQEQFKEQGYDLIWDQASQRAKVLPKGQVATPAQKAETPGAPADVAMLREKRKALAAKVKEGDSDAIVEDYTLAGQIHDAQLAEIQSWKERQEQETKTVREQAEQSAFQRSLDTFSAQYRTQKQKTFSGLSDTDYRSLVKGFADQSATWDELKQRMDTFASTIDRGVEERVKEMTKTAQPSGRPTGPAPQAPPAMGGQPPASGGAAKDRSQLAKSSKGFEADVDDWFGRSS